MSGILRSAASQKLERSVLEQRLSLVEKTLRGKCGMITHRKGSTSVSASGRDEESSSNLTDAQIRTLFKENRKPNFKDISKFPGGFRKNWWAASLWTIRLSLRLRWRRLQKISQYTLSQEAVQWLVPQPAASTWDQQKEHLVAVFGKNRMTLTYKEKAPKCPQTKSI